MFGPFLLMVNNDAPAETGPTGTHNASNATITVSNSVTVTDAQADTSYELLSFYGGYGLISTGDHVNVIIEPTGSINIDVNYSSRVYVSGDNPVLNNEGSIIFNGGGAVPAWYNYPDSYGSH
jgi:hypothetical protein